MAVSVEFQKRVSQLVDDADYGRTELRSLMGLSSTAFTNAVVYGILPTPKTLIKIADYFEVSLPYLLGKTDTNDFTPSTKNHSFQDRFKELCEEKKVTHYRVSADCGLDNSLILRWYTKGYTPALETIEALCDYFKVSPDYILGRSDFRD